MIAKVWIIQEILLSALFVTNFPNKEEIEEILFCTLGHNLYCVGNGLESEIFDIDPKIL